MSKAYYAVIPANVRYDTNLKPNAKLLYGEVTALANERGYCWAKNSYFSELYGVHKNTAGAWIDSLVEKGYLDRQVVRDERKVIIERRLFIPNPTMKKVETLQSNEPAPINEKIDTYQSKDGDPINEKIDTLSTKSLKSNNTVFNNTLNITKPPYPLPGAMEPEPLREIGEVIHYLNSKTGSNYKPSVKKYRELIGELIKQGATMDEFQYVIDVAFATWTGKDKRFLSPHTLFKDSNFDMLLNREMPKADLRDLMANGSITLDLEGFR